MNDQTQVNNDPIKQPVDLKSVQETDPKKSWPDEDTGEASHPVIQDQDKLKDSGKDIGLVHAPVTSVNPSSGNTLNNDKAIDNIVEVANPDRFLNDDLSARYDFDFPYQDTAPGEAFFVPVEAGNTTDALMAKMHKQVYQLQQMTSECEKDENGDDVWESVIIQTKKRKDGVIQLASDGKPIVGANQTNRPKLIHSINYLLRPVVKGNDMGDGIIADSDGVLAIRVL